MNSLVRTCDICGVCDTPVCPKILEKKKDENVRKETSRVDEITETISSITTLDEAQAAIDKLEPISPVEAFVVMRAAFHASPKMDHESLDMVVGQVQHRYFDFCEIWNKELYPGTVYTREMLYKK